jgi:hypothetical protein
VSQDDETGTDLVCISGNFNGRVTASDDRGHGKPLIAQIGHRLPQDGLQLRVFLAPNINEPHGLSYGNTAAKRSDTDEVQFGPMQARKFCRLIERKFAERRSIVGEHNFFEHRYLLSFRPHGLKACYRMLRGGVPFVVEG